MEDAEIIQLYMNRSEAAISETAAKYGRWCSSVALRILGDPAEAEECVNDAWLSLWKAIPPEQPKDLRAYAAGVVRNGALSRLRARSAARRGGEGADLPLEELADCLPAPDRTEEAVINRLVLTDLLNRFLSELSPRDRVVFLRRYWYFCSVEEIAALGGMGKSAVKMSLHRARNRLRRLLEKEGVYHG